MRIRATDIPENVELKCNSISDNPCLDQADGCDQRWSGKLTIPQEYMPPNVNRMNAYAIRSNKNILS